MNETIKHLSNGDFEVEKPSLPEDKEDFYKYERFDRNK